MYPSDQQPILGHDIKRPRCRSENN